MNEIESSAPRTWRDGLEVSGYGRWVVVATMLVSLGCTSFDSAAIGVAVDYSKSESGVRLIDLSTQVAASGRDTWFVVSDFANPHLYLAGIDRTEMLTSSHTGVGAARRVEFPSGYMVQQVEVWNPPNALGYTVVETNAPVTDGRLLFEVDDDGARTTLRAHLEYRPRFGIVGTVINTVMLQREFTKQVAEGLAELRAAAEAR